LETDTAMMDSDEIDSGEIDSGEIEHAAAADEVEAARVSRRSAIKKAAAVVGTAWVAPVILDSFLSPAAAASGPCTLYIYKVHAQANACSLFAVQTVANCATPLTTSSCTTCTTCAAGTTWVRTADNDLTQSACTYANGGALNITVSAPTGRAFVGFRIQVGCAGAAVVTLAQGSGTTTQAMTLNPVANNTDVFMYLLVS
jgi:hypothetical protein